ncbi:GNAT family N-acetyltransferase [Cytobacillus firmus]|uniref:GNAT family N-acetyltransferase n=1 Tax=Cytobacillus firmus TaxID=1399 RepID=UPI001C955634|nr:GNAT family N-acetyltransferase [Cytobacillus firmus]MBY6051854.1 GNAT family N-acetyltransferase [Cytobacillus firmus]
MIRQLTEQDHEMCFSLLKQQPAENLFIIGDIEAYGYEQDFQKVWGDFGEDGKLKAVQAVPEDAEQLVELLNSIPEFSDSAITVERKRRVLKDGSSRSFFIKEDGKMVSTASTTAENSLSAMVVGVATDSEFKKKGYATQCMVKLCRQLLSENKELCLFYDNPAAGTIYKRIGFEDIGFWMMYTIEKKMS